MGGRGDAYEKYIETFEHWRKAGWQVSAADWRGQAGSGRLGLDAVTGHIDTFDIWVDDLAGLWQDWTRQNPGPHVLVGHSMGGHLALRAMADQVLDSAPAALVLSTPMMDVQPEIVPPFVKLTVARLMSAIGDPRRPAWKWGDRPGEIPASRQGLLTHDDARYSDELWWRQARPELVMGPGSWGWVASAMESVRKLVKPEVMEQVQPPILIMATRADRLVAVRAIGRAAARLRDVEVLWFGSECRHEILREVDDVRDHALRHIDDFLNRRVAA